ncbi:DUF6221 family protein [Streptomyces coerulescens]|uniref:DUF6221 family protein n=1 Tax=Streptomyces coerulescens TaxID=29304 RepID=A0ABW0CQ02_STRCD
MDDLVRWLGQQLNEDERIARAACWDEQSDEWTARPPQASYERYTVADYLDDGVVVVTPENADADGVGQHVALHDPARVLREIEAKRLQIAWCTATIGHRDPARYRDALEKDDPDALAVMLAVKTLRLLAGPYADRPGYREEWRP